MKVDSYLPCLLVLGRNSFKFIAYYAFTFLVTTTKYNISLYRVCSLVFTSIQIHDYF